MTASETGIYITLIAMMYERGEPIPNDTGRLARLCGTTTAALRSTLATLVNEGKIILNDDGLWNERVGVETEIRRDKSTSARESAETRWQKRQQKQRKADANAKRSQCARNANQNQSQIETPSDEGVKRAPEKPTPRSELEKVLDPDHATAVIEHRKAKRSALTAHVAAKLAKQLAKWPDPNEAADEMMLAGWTGFNPDWLERRLTDNRGPPGSTNGQATGWQRQKQAIDEVFDERDRNQRTAAEIDHVDVRRLPEPGANGR